MHPIQAPLTHHLFELFENVALNQLEPLLRHDWQLAIIDRLLKGQLGGKHLLQIPSEGGLIPLRQDHRAADLFSVVAECRHLCQFLTISFHAAEIFGADILKLCVEVGGCLTGEHGVGVEKRDLMPVQFRDHELQQQRDLKSAFDPDWLLNPSKVFPLLEAAVLPQAA